MYDYLRTPRVASDVKSKPYDEALQAIQIAFVGALGESVFDYIQTLHRRVGKRSPFSEISGFQSWDYGSVKTSAGNLHGIRVYQKDISPYPGDLAPVIDIDVEFLSPHIGVLARAGRQPIYSKSIKLSTSPGHLALGIGASWEKLLTGTIEWER